MKCFQRSLGVTALSVMLSLLILGAVSCTVSETGNTNMAATNSNTNAAAGNSNANMSATASSSATAEAVTAKEKQVWDAIKNKNFDAFGNMLSSDMVYVSTDGVSDKAATINGVKMLNATEVILSDWKTLMLDKDAAVVIYTVEVKGTSDGQPIPPGALRASSAWVKRGTEWVAVYHQDSEIRKSPASTPATTTAETSKPASSATNDNAPASTAKHAEMAASDDPVAIEKHLWDALKQKDWDIFASHLAPEQIEVEPGGVYDRAGTLASVKEVDFSKTTVSDFKATKFDDDATLVTYLVKGTGPDGKPAEHHASTIWVKRDGKWTVFFHHGTPAMKMPAK